MSLLFLLTLCGCAHIDIESRPGSVLPACLLVTKTDWSWGKEEVQEAADFWNEKLKKEAFRLAPNCKAGDDLVPFAFLRSLPDDCGERGCTLSYIIIRGVPTMREVLIHEEAPFSTIVHELGHLAGCRHGDFGEPCPPSFGMFKRDLSPPAPNFRY